MAPEPEVHDIRVHDDGASYWRSCSCGYRSVSFAGKPREGLAASPCPQDQTITSLSTLQFSWGGLLDSRPADDYAVHLVRRAASGGTPGPALCGLDRFGPDAPGWDIGGGLDGPGIVHTPCPGCVAAAKAEFPGLPVHGSVGAREIAAVLEAGHAR